MIEWTAEELLWSRGKRLVGVGGGGVGDKGWIQKLYVQMFFFCLLPAPFPPSFDFPLPCLQQFLSDLDSLTVADADVLIRWIGCSKI